MGNQECSARHAPECLKDLPLQRRGWDLWDDGQQQQQYSTAEPDGVSTGNSREADGGNYPGTIGGLSVEDVVEASSRRRALEQVAEVDEATREWGFGDDGAVDRGQEKNTDLQWQRTAMTLSAETGDAPESGRLPKTYFDSDVGEAPFVEDDAALERIRHEFRSGAIYDGDWLCGMRHGVGKQMWPDGTEYVGEWYRGRASGKGQIKHCDGDIYVGQWINGRAHGLGVYRFQDGAASYQGEFRCDHRHGVGVETWVDGSCFAGTFKQGEKCGYGSNKWPDGTVYNGSWQANALSGPGQYIVHDGTAFRGQWEQSTPHGIGRYEWPNGKLYCGKYRFDKKDGFGILTEVDGSVRQGFWVKGELPAGA